MENWSLVEIMWTLAAGFGFYFSFENISDSGRDKAVLIANTPENGDIAKALVWKMAMAVANGNIRRDAIRGIIQTVFILVGVLAAFVPPNPVQSPLTVFGGIVFTLISGLLTFSGISDLRERRQLLRDRALLELQTHDG